MRSRARRRSIGWRGNRSATRNAFTTAPVCAPSRAAIITGMYQTAIGAQHMRTTEDTRARAAGTVPGRAAVLREGVSRIPARRRLLHDAIAPRPTTSSACRSRSGTTSATTRTGAIARTRASRSSRCSTSRSRTRARSFPSSPARKGKPLVTDPAKIPVPPYYPDTPARARRARAHVRQHRRHGRRRSARSSKQLEDDGLAENTIVFYWSDHGDGVPRAKRSLYDSGLRVPLMIRWPKALGAAGRARHRCSDELVSFIDLAPTVLALAGVEIPDASAGTRARRARRPRRAPEYVFAARDRMDIEYDMMRSARDARFLYIRNFAPELPYAGHIIYRNQSAIMQEWLRLQAEGKLTGPGRALDADAAARRGAVRHERRSAPDPRPRRRSGASRDARAHAQGGDRLDDAHRRSGADQRAGDDSADVARRRAAGDGAALHRAAARRPTRRRGRRR